MQFAGQGPPSGGNGGMGQRSSGPRNKKRRRNRSQRPREQRAPSGGEGVIDVVNRERMFQDVEGLLRQIRERAEETAEWSMEQLSDFTQAVTGFTKSLEQEGDSVSQRVRSDYQRVRDKLSQALRN
jgi:hypothetical protein